jgi:hypothetical protein
MAGWDERRKPPGPTRKTERDLGFYLERMTGFEPATSTLARLRSSQLSYIRKEGEV